MSADLDRLVARVDCILFDFDGPVCSVFAGLPASGIATALRRQLPKPIPADIETTDDPVEVLAHALTLDRAVADQVEATMAEAEERAVQIRDRHTRRGPKL